MADFRKPAQGALKAIQAASKAADEKLAKMLSHSGDKALPLVLPRANPSNDFINQQAERVARQMMGEHVTTGKDTTNLAGRSVKESQRVKGLDYKLSPTGTVAKETPYIPRKGDVKVAFPGDQTVSNKTLDEVNGFPIDSVQEGGAYYGLGQRHLADPEFWKSTETPAKAVQGKVDRVAELYQPERVIGSHLAMGQMSNNFAMHFADANLRAIDWSKAKPNKIDTFDSIIAYGYKDPKTGEAVKFPNWPGLADREGALAAMKEDSNLRKWFNNRMKTPTITKPLGLPNGLDIQYAITEPRIRDMEINMTGLMTGELKPKALVEAAGNPHNTYTHRILGEAGGPQEVLSPFVIDFPDAAQHIASTKQPSDFTGTIQKVFPHQVVDDQYINQYNQYRQRIKELTGQKKGGAVERKETAEEMDKFHKCFNMHKAFGGAVVKKVDGGKVVKGLMGAIEKASAAADAAMALPKVDRLSMSYKDVTKRVPEVAEAIEKLNRGEITKQQYNDVVNLYKPVTPYSFVPKPATKEEAIDALRGDAAKSRYGKQDEYEPGSKVGLRLDIPAYTGKGVWVNSIHNEKAKKVAYGPVASVKNADLNISQSESKRIALGGAKAPYARIKGEWNPMTEEEAVANAQKYLNDPEWKQIGIDPERHSYFYDRRTMQPITNAEEIIQIGPLVLGKNPKYASIDDFEYADGGKVASKLVNAFKKASNAADAAIASNKALPAAERDANLAKFLEPSKAKERLYHGTGQGDISAFKSPPSKKVPPGYMWGQKGDETYNRGVFLSPNPEMANHFAKRGTKSAEDDAGQYAVYPVRAQIERPFDYENSEHRKMLTQFFQKQYDDWHKTNPEAKRMPDVNMEYLLDNPNMNFQAIESPEMLHAIEKLGFDSFYTSEGKAKNIGVFDPRKIKSDIGNRGSYDINEADINKAEGGAMLTPTKKTEGFKEEKPMDKSILEKMHQAVKEVPKLPTSPLGAVLNLGYEGYKYFSGKDPVGDFQKEVNRKLNPKMDTGSAPVQEFEKFAKGGRVQESPEEMARFHKCFAMHKAFGGAVKKPQKFDDGGIASPEESSASDGKETKAGLMAELLAKAAKDQGKEELSSLKKPRAATDLLNRGVLANNPVSAIIDMVNMGLVPLDVLGSALTGRNIKVSSDKPFLGSEHLKDLMNEYNITSGEERPMMETALSFASPVGMIKGAQKTADLAKKAPEALNTVRGGLETASADVQRPFRSATLTMEGVAPDLGQKGGDKFKDLVTKRMISGEGAPVSMERMGGRKTEQTMGQGLYENFAKQLETNPMVGVTIPRAGNLSTNKRLIADIGTAGRELGQEMVAAHKFTPLLFRNPKDATAMMIGGSEPLTKDQIRDIYKLLPNMIVTHSPKNNSMFIAPFEGDALDYKKAAQAASDILGKGAKVQFGKADSTKDIMFRGDYDKMEARPPSAESTEMRNRLKKAEERIVRGPSVSQSGRQSQPSTLTSTVR